jgi:hypothetical protein
VDWSRRSLSRVLVPALVVVAVVGYLLGVHHTSSTSHSPSAGAGGQHLRIASGASMLLEYPSGWQSASSAPTIPGFPISEPLFLAPGGKSANAGLVSGQLPAGGPSPLPATFLALLRVVPHVEVLTLEHVQAYRYSGLSGYGRTLDVYVIPTVGASPATLVCYGSGGSAAYLEECEQIVATVTLVGGSTYPLSPNAGYANQLAALIGALDRERLTLRSQISASSAPARLSSLASTLATRFSDTATPLTALEAPQAASAAQAALAAALVGAGSAYTELARAADAEEPAAYNAAEQRVDAAEASVNTALENFALLGYNHT